MIKKAQIVWLRRDLRLDDNRALFEANAKASKTGTKVILVFIFDSEILSKLPSKQDRRVSFIWQSLMELKEQLGKNGSDVLILSGNPIEIWPKICENLDVEGVYCNEDYDSYSIKRDNRVKEILAKQDISLESFKDHVIFRGNEVLKKDGTPYKVFTPYKNAWLKQISDRETQKYNLKSSDFLLESSAFSKLKSKLSFSIDALAKTGFQLVDTPLEGGESNANRQFENFRRKIESYHNARDLFNIKGTSNLSPYLRFGCISTRSVVRAVMRLAPSEGSSTWLSEIIWRDFYNMILFCFPHVEKKAFKEKYDNIKWPGNKKALETWKRGETGFPVIDAAMRELSKSGMMHNRLRMIVASFLTKDLLVNWQEGERHFAELLLDYDLASNNGGWQWAASTGCDAQPYFRIFNPYSQSKKFDPNGEYIKLHIPELKNLPSKYIHEPHLAPLEVQEQAKCQIGRDYPMPIVDHKIQRELALKLFKT